MTNNSNQLETLDEQILKKLQYHNNDTQNKILKIIDII